MSIRPAQQSLVLILEDLHWADEMSLSLLSFLARRVEAWPVMAVTTVREEAVADHPVVSRLLDDLARDRRVIQLSLPPLTRPETTSLVEALGVTAGDDTWFKWFEERVWSVSEGNPFMVVETTRALRRTRRLLEVFGLGPLEGLQHLALPRSIKEAVKSRVERLSDVSKHMVATAAVIGREFEFSLLRLASELDEREAAEAVEELVRRRILQGIGERSGFTHDRIRELTYGELLAPRRKLLHGLVAKAIEDLYADDLEPHYGILGLHSRRAEAWDKAFRYFHEAARTADRAFATREAIALYDQALEAAAHLRETVEANALMTIYRNKSRLHFLLSDFERSKTEAERLLVLARRVGDRNGEAEALTLLGQAAHQGS